MRTTVSTLYVKSSPFSSASLSVPTYFFTSRAIVALSTKVPSQQGVEFRHVAGGGGFIGSRQTQAMSADRPATSGALDRAIRIMACR